MELMFINIQELVNWNSKLYYESVGAESSLLIGKNLFKSLNFMICVRVDVDR